MAESKNTVPVLFKFGTHAEYEALKSANGVVNNALYFISDTNEIYKGEQNLAKGHFYSSVRQDTESDTEIIVRVLDNKTAVNGDFFVVLDAIDNEPEKYIQTIYFYDGEDWRSITGNIRASNIVFEEDITVNGQLIEATGKTIKEVIESLPVATEPVFNIQGSVENTSELEDKKNEAKPGDVWIDKETNTGYVFDGEDFTELDIAELDLDKYATKEDLESLDRLTGIAIDGELIPINNKVGQLSTFDGTKSGLIPIYTAVGEDDSEKRVLNAKGQWIIPVDDRVGTLKYNETTYNTVTEYVDARMEDVTITWTGIAEE